MGYITVESENECLTKNIVAAAGDNETQFILLLLFLFVSFFFWCRRHMCSLEHSHFINIYMYYVMS